MTRRLLRGLALALLLALAGTAPAHAHALLEGTVPERGVALDRAPREVVLRFSEPVETALGAIRVYDAQGRAVQSGSPSHPRGRGDEVAIALPDDLPDVIRHDVSGMEMNETLTLAAVAIPECMGYTSIAQTPIATGLYTVIFPTIRKLFSTTTTTTLIPRMLR